MKKQPARLLLSCLLFLPIVSLLVRNSFLS